MRQQHDDTVPDGAIIIQNNLIPRQCPRDEQQHETLPDTCFYRAIPSCPLFVSVTTTTNPIRTRLKRRTVTKAVF